MADELITDYARVVFFKFYCEKLSNLVALCGCLFSSAATRLIDRASSEVHREGNHETNNIGNKITYLYLSACLAAVGFCFLRSRNPAT
jgi:hypothetical protein